MRNTKKAFRAASLALVLAGAGWAGLTFADTHTDDAGAAGEGHMMQGTDQNGMMDAPSGFMEGMQHGDMADEQPDGMEGMDRGAPAAGEAGPVIDSPWAEDYRAANLGMHSAMDIQFSEDADIDYARGMIAHHQGAIDMSRVVLEHGDDPDLRALAEEVIAAQEAEIEFLRNWLAERAE